MAGNSASSSTAVWGRSTVAMARAGRQRRSRSPRSRARRACPPSSTTASCSAVSSAIASRAWQPQYSHTARTSFVGGGHLPSSLLHSTYVEIQMPLPRARETEMTPAETAPDVRVGQMRNLGLATLAFAMTFWAWNLIAPLGVRYTEQFGLTLRPEGAARRHAGARGLAGPDRDRRAGRPLRRPADVQPALLRLRPAGAPGGLRGQPHVVPAAARVGLLPRHRRHDVRRRDPVRQRVVRPRAARLRDRHLRRRHGRHGAVGLLHPALRHLVRLHPDLPARGGRGGRRRRRELDDDGRLAALDPEPRAGRPQARRGAPAAGHLGDVVPLRRDVRRLRRLRDLPADVPQGRLRLRPHPGRDPHRRLRPGRGRRTADRRRPLRPGAPASGGPDLPGRRGR